MTELIDIIEDNKTLIEIILGIIFNGYTIYIIIKIIMNINIKNIGNKQIINTKDSDTTQVANLYGDGKIEQNIHPTIIQKYKNDYDERVKRKTMMFQIERFKKKKKETEEEYKHKKIEVYDRIMNNHEKRGLLPLNKHFAEIEINMEYKKLDNEKNSKLEDIQLEIDKLEEKLNKK